MVEDWMRTHHVHPFACKRITLIVVAISAQTPLDRDGSYSNPDLAVFP
jgi:hypothetical protein